VVVVAGYSSSSSTPRSYLHLKLENTQVCKPPPGAAILNFVESHIS